MKNRIEVSVKEVGIFSLKMWWLILLCMVLISFGYTMSSYLKHQDTLNSLRLSHEKATEEYEANLMKLSTVVSKHNQMEEYMRNSVFMRVIPQNVKRSTLSLSISLDKGNYSDKRTVVDYYMVYVNDADYHKVFAAYNTENLEGKTLNELVTVERGQSDLITITVIGDSKVDTTGFANALYKYLETKTEDIIEKTKIEHRLVLISEAEKVVTDATIRSNQNADQRTFTALQNEVEQLESKRPKEIVSLPFPLVSSVSIGALTGAVFGLLIVIALYFCRMPIQYVAQIQDQLGIRFFGKLHKEEGPRTSLIRKLSEGRLTKQSIQQALQFVNANLDEALSGEKNILFLGTMDKQEAHQSIRELIQLYQQRGVIVAVGDNIDLDSDAVALLHEADAVVFVERIGFSSIRQIERQLQRVGQANKRAIGYILV